MRRQFVNTMVIAVMMAALSLAVPMETAANPDVDTGFLVILDQDGPQTTYIYATTVGRFDDDITDETRATTWTRMPPEVSTIFIGNMNANGSGVAASTRVMTGTGTQKCSAAKEVGRARRSNRTEPRESHNKANAKTQTRTLFDESAGHASGAAQEVGTVCIGNDEHESATTTPSRHALKFG